jgi:hypothetical protein
MNNGTNNTATKTRTNSQFWAWRFDEVGYNKTSAGPVWGRDAYDAAGEARRLHGAGRYQIREAAATGRIVLRYA